MYYTVRRRTYKLYWADVLRRGGRVMRALVLRCSVRHQPYVLGDSLRSKSGRHRRYLPTEYPPARATRVCSIVGLGFVYGTGSCTAVPPTTTSPRNSQHRAVRGAEHRGATNMWSAAELVQNLTHVSYGERDKVPVWISPTLRCSPPYINIHRVSRVRHLTRGAGDQTASRQQQEKS